MKIRSALFVGAALALLLATCSIAVTAMYKPKIDRLDDAERQVRIATRSVSGLLAMEQDALLHQSPRATKQWHAIHAVLLQSMHDLADHLGPHNHAINLVASMTSVVVALPDQYDAVFTIADTGSDLERERRETLIDHLTIETRRISDEAFELTEILGEQRTTARTERLQVQAGFTSMFFVLIVSSMWFGFRRILKPVDVLTNTALKVQGGDMSAVNAIETGDELGLLGTTFDDMTHALNERQQKLMDSQRETASLYKTLNNHSIVSVADRHGKIVSVNDAFCQISGYLRDEVVGRDHRILNSGVQADAFWVDFWSTINRGQAWRGEICNRAKDGSLYWVDSMVMPMLDEAGNIEKYISIRSDITARKKTQSALQISNALLEESQKIAQVGGWELNLETQVLYWTAETYRLHETSPGEFNPSVNAGVGYFLPGSRERIETAIKRAIEQGEPYDLELETYTTKGNRIDVRTTCTPWVVEGKVTRLSGIFQDITHRKQYERALRDARDSAQQVAASKGQFLANMSHEIRTPMNAILGLLNLLQGTELTARQRDYASKTEGAAQSLLGIINDILDFSKVDAGKMTLESEPMRLGSLMRNLSVLLSANVGNKDIDVLFDMDPTVPTVVRGDAMRLQQVLINLGGNAIKFTSRGHVVVSLQKLAEAENTVTIRFAVQDTGIGIPPEHQKHIFSGFSQAEGSTTRRFGGTGLGLAISRRFVQLMGGDIHITSEPSVGSTFAFTLEMPKLNAMEHAQVEPQRPDTLPKRVLVVDDKLIAGDLSLRMVHSWGCEADLATSGQHAIDMVSAHTDPESGEFPYPVIYMDWQMPDMDGWEATRQIRLLAQQHALPQPTVIMVTAHGREMLTQRTDEEQSLVNGFLVKPATASMLYDAWVDAQANNSGMRKTTGGRSSTRQLQGMRILVVEDNLINQQVADELLSAEGATVILAANGQLGVEAVAAAAPQFDVVLMDVQMPVLDGYGATRAIREDLRLVDLPIIAMTANAMASDRDTCLDSGMNEHIGKPFDMAILVALLVRKTGIQADPAQTDTQEALPTLATPAPVVTGLDIQTALNRMSGMRSLYLRTAKDFVKILLTAIPELQICLRDGNKKQAMLKLHTLKGNAGTLGAMDLAAHAASLEKRCIASADLQEFEAGMAELEWMVRSTQEKMLEAIVLLKAEADTENAVASNARPKPVSPAAIDALEKIAALAKVADMEVLQEFAQARTLMAEFPVDSVDALDLALQDLDLEAAASVCRQIFQQVHG